MGKDYTEARNDHLIEEILEDPNFKIKRDGTIYSKITENGQGISDKWREVGYEKDDGYVRFRYKGEFIFAQRVIFRKFKGKLKPNMTINHKDLDSSNNAASNLEQVSREENNQKKHKKYKKAEIIKRVIEKICQR
jgi:hypothetical protein